MGRFPKYQSFKDGELAATIHKLDPQGYQSSDSSGASTLRSRSGLITSYSCTVTYPDGQAGICRYTRGGPAWHIFRFEHMGKDGKKTTFPVQHKTDRIGSSIAVIEEKAISLASSAFSEAVKREQREHFQRAVAPPNQRADMLPQMKVKEAKELSGHYALCLRVGRSLLPTSSTWQTLDTAMAMWQASRNEADTKLRPTVLVIGCCCRWKRRWEEPYFNPLHADPTYPLPYTCPDKQSGQEEAIEGAIATQGAVATDEAIGSEDCPDPMVGEDIPPPGDSDAPPEIPDMSPDTGGLPDPDGTPVRDEFEKIDSRNEGDHTP